MEASCRRFGGTTSDSQWLFELRITVRTGRFNYFWTDLTNTLMTGHLWIFVFGHFWTITTIIGHFWTITTIIGHFWTITTITGHI